MAAGGSESGGSAVVHRSQQADRILELARQEAGRFGHRYLGPEHLVLGLLRDGGNGAARVLQAYGVELPAAQAALGRLAERGVVPGPRPSDAELLGTLGIDLEAIRRTTQQAFGGTALGWAIREATRARRGGIGRVPRTPLRDPPWLIGQTLFHAGEQARALGLEVIGPELLLVGVVTDVQTPWPRCMNNRWRRALHASVGLPKRYRGAAGPLLAAFGIDLQQLHAALLAELRAGVP
jgi:Clp amino terminal domain, pathogenicity island component